MMAGQTSNPEQFEAYFQRADLDRDGRISSNEAVAFLQGSNLPRQVLAQIWMYADHNKIGSLGRPEFYNVLKLVTVAQSKRELTPDIVKAALYGLASSKIPAPQINLATTAGPQFNAVPGPSTVQLGGPPVSTQGIAVNALHGSLTPQSQVMRSPLPPTSGSPSQPAVSAQVVPGTNVLSVSQHSNSSGRRVINDGTRAGVSSQVSDRSVIPSASQGGFSSSPVTQPKPPEVTGFLQSASTKPNDAASSITQGGKEDSKVLSTKGNGFASDSVFGDVFSAAPSEPQQSSNSLPLPTSSVPALSTSLDEPTIRPGGVSQQPATQIQQFQSSGKGNQYTSAQKSSLVPVVSGQSQAPWPRMTQVDVQRYSKVFVQVDRDRDGKIDGAEARTLFLSWRLPREVLKQVWDLSDQDNDSMLSLKEFCIALYLMERYREGRTLPTALLDSVIFDQASLPSSTQPAYGNPSWRPYPGFQQAHGIKNARSIPSAGGGKPPRPVPGPQPDEPIQQKAKVPVLEKHLLNQLSTEEQNSLNKKLEEAKDAEKKVADLEKDILEAKQKIQFYHAKMQELILYKSRCENRLNELSEKVVADKREADSLAKKYEEKYKQVGDVASKLTIEEATFRDIQERKMELYRAVVKLEQDNPDGIEERVSQIQSDLENLVKALTERCKTYGVRGKPTSLIELPFGWQPGIVAAAADWDDAWDKFEDEGFSYVKELTLEVQNVIAPPRQKTALNREKVIDDGSAVKSTYESELPSSMEKLPENDGQNMHNSEQTERSPPDSPAESNSVASPSKEFRDIRREKDINSNGSPHAFDTRSEYGAESVLSGEKGFDEPHWGSFDAYYDTDSARDFNPVSPKENESERQIDGFLFSGDDWALNPIRTVSRSQDTTLLKQGPFFDSVPSTPLYTSASTPHRDNLVMRNSPFAFADSVPSSPMYNSTRTSPRREGQYSFDSFSKFDSFNMHDSDPFSSRETFTRFDSMRSTRDSDFDLGYFTSMESPSLARFDSFRSTADSDYNFERIPTGESVSRFDSMRSTRDTEIGHGFSSSFNDATDPFGGDAFKTSHETQNPRRESDSWKAF